MHGGGGSSFLKGPRKGKTELKSKQHFFFCIKLLNYNQTNANYASCNCQM